MQKRSLRVPVVTRLRHDRPYQKLTLKSVRVAIRFIRESRNSLTLPVVSSGSDSGTVSRNNSPDEKERVTTLLFLWLDDARKAIVEASRHSGKQSHDYPIIHTGNTVRPIFGV